MGLCPPYSVHSHQRPAHKHVARLVAGAVIVPGAVLARGTVIVTRTALISIILLHARSTACRDMQDKLTGPWEEHGHRNGGHRTGDGHHSDGRRIAGGRRSDGRRL